MSDAADDGNEMMELTLRCELAVRKVFLKLVAKQECHNCEAELYDEALYCNAECSNEHQWYLERKVGNTKC